MNKTKCVQELIKLMTLTLQELEQHQADLQSALYAESRSTAGDKHDTSRAMIHLEQEKIQFQIGNIQKQISVLQQFEKQPASESTQSGSMLILDSGQVFLIGIGLGRKKIKYGEIFCVSLDTPVGQQFLGKRLGDEVVFAGRSATLVQLQ
jgi:transcription elongation GreA/GreB family factor